MSHFTRPIRDPITIHKVENGFVVIADRAYNTLNPIGTELAYIADDSNLSDTIREAQKINDANYLARLQVWEKKEKEEENKKEKKNA